VIESVTFKSIGIDGLEEMLDTISIGIDVLAASVLVSSNRKRHTINVAQARRFARRFAKRNQILTSFVGQPNTKIGKHAQTPMMKHCKILFSRSTLLKALQLV
jgi:hypothetical protein